ncbi:MAG: hypothetical protein JKY08_07940 [Flavobacteriaceae bacterium]|nr:hypothetical protein [Flavobacteriaceae bacterium]
MANQNTEIYITSVNFGNRTLEYEGKVITLTTTTALYKCAHCSEEITLKQVQESIGTKKLTSTQTKNINDVLIYMNKYRANFGLDTCLRKAHFIAQVCHESNRFKKFEEGEKWSYKINGVVRSLPGVFSNKSIEFDKTMGESLKKYLDKIFLFKDKNDEKIIKTNEEINKILLDEKIKVVDKKLYTNYQSGEELLGIIKESIKKDGKDVQQIKYKIYLQNHTHFGIPLLSRMYAPYIGDNRGLGNGDELSRDGWKYKGRGLKQLTGVGNYKSFTTYRNKTDIIFTDDTSEDTSDDIDFEKNDDLTRPKDVRKGNYVKLREPIYAVQSGLYFWNEGTKYKSKYAFEHADSDKINYVSRAVNRNDSGNESNRKAFYLKARKKEVFDINRHYKLMLEKGSESEKKVAKTYLTDRKDNNKDAQAKTILEEYAKTQKKETKKKIVKEGISLAIKDDLKLVPLKGK